MTHTRIIVTHYGGPEALHVLEEECPVELTRFDGGFTAFAHTSNSSPFS